MDANHGMGTHKPDHMEGTELHHDELLDLLQETECGDVMKMWEEALLRQVERNEAATWKREKNFKSLVVGTCQGMAGC